jgi:hypothetical protein
VNWGQLALVAAALFAGAAFYVSAVEHPARQKLSPEDALAQWKPAYQRGANMQASLALVGFLLGLVAWWVSGGWLWALGAIVLVANWPYTVFAIMPTNRRLKSIDPAVAGVESRALLDVWARLHMVRTALGITATLIFLAASLR